MDDIPLNNAGHDQRYGSFARAIKTDARYGTFNDIGRDLNITYMNRLRVEEDLISKLKPVDCVGSSIGRCMDGTREYVFKEIDNWIADLDTPNVLWIKGDPGAGKSTIASSMEFRLIDRRRLRSSFFFRRGNVVLSDPAALWRTVAYDLAKHEPFAKSLVKVMQESGVDPERPYIDLHFKYLIAEPLKDAYDASKPHLTPVIIIDALDECDYDYSQDQQREVLLNTLMQWSLLPKMFKLILTSRDDRIPELFRVTCKTINLPTGENVTDEANNDIRQFFRRRFSELTLSPFSEWPGEDILDVLTVRAAGLFIWADAVTRFMEQDSPSDQLELVLSGDLGEEDGLTVLYRQILYAAMRGTLKEKTRRSFKSVLRTLVLAKVPFHRDELHLFVSETKQTVEFILKRLSSVTSTTDKGLRICHLTFSEFLCDRNRCPEEFLIDQRIGSHRMAITCFRHMREGLKFNICDFQTSRMFNNQVENISEQVERMIPGSLSYSCRFWAFHLRDTPMLPKYSHDLLPEVKQFFYCHFLFWLEAMSLVVEDALVANVALLTAISWIEKFDTDLFAFAKDASRFIATFDVPISASVPHIYLSTLPFCPSESLVAKKYLPMFPDFYVASSPDKHWPAMVRPFRGHADGVFSIAVSPDGNSIVSGSDDNTVRLWDLETGYTRKVLEGHTSRVNSVSFSSDGKRVVSGSADKTVRVWDVETCQTTTGPLEGHTDSVTSVAFSPDGKYVVSGSDDKTSRIWDVDNGHTINDPLHIHDDCVTSVAFSSDGRHVVSGSDDKAIRIWDVKTGQISTSLLMGDAYAIKAVAFSPDGKHIVSGSQDTTVMIWDVETGQATRLEGHQNTVFSVSFSPDGRRVVSGSADKTIQVWDVETGQNISGPLASHTDHVTSVVFSPDGKRVISGSDDRTIRIWDIETSKNRLTSNMAAIYSVAFSPNGKYVVSASRAKAFQIWNVETGKLITVFDGHKSIVKSVAFSPDSRYIVSCSNDRTIRIWDFWSRRTIQGPLEGHTSRVESVAFSPDGRYVVSGSADNTIRIWDVNSGDSRTIPLKGHQSCANSVSFSPDSKHIVSGTADKRIMICNIETERFITLTGHTGSVLTVAFSPDGSRIVSGSDDKTIRVWDVETCQTTTGPLHGHTDAVASVAFSPDGHHFVSGSWDQTIRIWDARTGETVTSPIASHSDRVSSVAFSSDGRRLVSGSWDTTIRIWDFEILRSSHTTKHLDISAPVRGGYVLRLDRSFHSNGWLYSQGMGEDGDDFPVIWVPEIRRGGMCGIETLQILGTRMTRLDLGKFKDGTSWTQYYSPSDGNLRTVTPSVEEGGSQSTQILTEVSEASYTQLPAVPPRSRKSLGGAFKSLRNKIKLIQKPH